MTVKKYIWEGHTSFTRPTTAFGASPITSDEQFKELGGIIELIELPDPPAPRTCTKYQFVNACKKINNAIYDKLRTLYTQSADLQFYWNTVQDLDRDNADFKAFAAAAEVTDAQLDDIFNNL